MTKNNEVSIKMITTIDATNRKILEILESLVDRVTKLEKTMRIKEI